jgi:exopolysaccharide biosynthesis polyprenyl glycosylphosphotransferase
VTTSLRKPAGGTHPSDAATSRTTTGESVDQQDDWAPPASGVPRSGWARTRRLSRWHRPYTLALILLDVIAVIGADLTAVTQLEKKATAGFAHNLGLFHAITYLLLPLAWVAVLWANGAYDRRYLGIGTDEFKRVVRASLIMAAIVSFLAFSYQITLSRLSVATALLGAAVYISVLRYFARKVLHLLRHKGRATHRVLLVGTLGDALGVHTAVSRNPAAGMVPVGILVSDGYPAARVTKAPIPVHTGRDVVSLVNEVRADTVAVCGSASGEGDLRRLAWQLEGTGIDLVVAPQLTDIAGPRVHIRPVEGLPLLYVEEPTLSGVAWLFKTMIDRVVAGIGVILLSPLLLLVALAIKLTDRGPVFFRQARVGREGKTFRVWKFRTMYTDAEERLAALVDQNESDGLLFKIKDDPRITRIGRYLRASSVDELPQLFNVLLGQMSLVGPRPLPAEDGDFLGDVRRRLLVRPGITGLWQVSGRSDLSWDDAVRLDLYYVDNWSLTFDLTILWRTVGVVLRSKGAY